MNKNTMSPSVGVILDRLQTLEMTKVAFARRLDVSPEYVYRILNGKVAFPGIRETLEKMADILDIDPNLFPEYVRFQEGLSSSAKLVWDRMRELKVTREDLYRKIEGRISRPYFYGILRGDHPFPTNRAFIQLFATALDMDVKEFPEFDSTLAPRISQVDSEDLESRYLNMLFDKMMEARGYSAVPSEYRPIDPGMLLLYAKSFGKDLDAIFRRMGEWRFGVSDLSKLTGIPDRALHRIFLGVVSPATFKEDLTKIREALQING